MNKSDWVPNLMMSFAVVYFKSDIYKDHITMECTLPVRGTKCKAL
jgi:hypothetical protein